MQPWGEGMIEAGRGRREKFTRSVVQGMVTGEQTGYIIYIYDVQGMYYHACFVSWVMVRMVQVCRHVV